MHCDVPAAPEVNAPANIQDVARTLEAPILMDPSPIPSKLAIRFPARNARAL